MGQSIIIRTLITFFAGGCFIAGSYSKLISPTIASVVIIILVLAMLIFWRHRALRLIYGSVIALSFGIALTGWYVAWLTPADNFYGDFGAEGTVIAEPVNKPTNQQLIVKITSADTTPPTPPLNKGRRGGVVRNVLIKADT